jgi:hypothetical protein
MDDRTSSFTMIGLHKLAAGRDDGLVPELLALYSARERLTDAMPLVLDLPAGVVEEAPAKSSAGGDTVIPFRPFLLARKRR